MKMVTLSRLILVCLLLGGCTLISPRRTVKYLLYPVKRGDTVTAIGERFGASPSEIVRVNRIADARQLEIGQVLKIPVRSDTPKSSGSKSPSLRGEDMHKVARDAASLKTVRLNAARRYIGKLAWPVKSGRISSSFGKRWLSFHEGIDVAAPEGEAIVAAHDGRIVYSGSGLQGYGNLVVLKGDGIMTVYGHNSRNIAERGEIIKKGERIAEVGQTGKSTGPHLHYEIRIADSSNANAAVDPLVFYPAPASKS